VAVLGAERLAAVEAAHPGITGRLWMSLTASVAAEDDGRGADAGAA
jgi:hypothetical protein